MNLYHLERKTDVSGVSGTGFVAEVCEFENGWCAVAFRGESTGVSNIIVYSDIKHVEKIHGHNGSTQLVSKTHSNSYIEGMNYAAEVINGHLGSADALNHEDVRKTFPNLAKKIDELRRKP